MEFIELKSVGSLVTNLGDVHPTSDVDNKIAGEGVNIFECSDIQEFEFYGKTV